VSIISIFAEPHPSTLKVSLSQVLPTQHKYIFEGHSADLDTSSILLLATLIFKFSFSIKTS
jgi:hypothetical protein